MPKMTRSHYNKISEATHAILQEARALIGDREAGELFALRASKRMAESLAGTNSQFKFDRFRQNCLVGRRGR